MVVVGVSSGPTLKRVGQMDRWEHGSPSIDFNRVDCHAKLLFSLGTIERGSDMRDNALETGSVNAAKTGTCRVNSNSSRVRNVGSRRSAPAAVPKEKIIPSIAPYIKYQ